MSVVSRDVPSCPVCGSPAVLLDADDNGILKYFVYCLNTERCGLTSGMCVTPEEALKKWDKQKSYADFVHSDKKDRA